MTFTEDWYSDRSCAALAELVRKVRGLFGRIVEIGCWEGKSTVTIANEAWPATVLAVDTWAGSSGEVSAELAKERDVLAQFRKNVATLTQGNVTEVRADWRDYLAADRTPVRFCHIDATHTYDEVADNIRAVWPVILPGGILCGDDAAHSPVRSAVLDILGDDINLSAGTLWWVQKGVEHGTELSRQFREACKTPSDIYEHLPVFVEICRELEATRVIELGTRGGVSTIAWLYGLKEQDGHLWSVDIDPAPELEFDGWTFIRGDDLDPQVVRALPDSVDVVFIDTSHAYEDTLAELNVYLRKVRPGGRIVLHDSELRRPQELTSRQPPFPVKVAVEEFCTEETFEWTNLTNNNGLAIISIPEG